MVLGTSIMELNHASSRRMRALGMRLTKELLEKVCTYNERWVNRSLHRNAHLDAIDSALKK